MPNLVTLLHPSEDFIYALPETELDYYCGTLKSYSSPQTPEEFVSFLRQISSIVGTVRGEQARLEFNNIADLVQLYSDGYFYPLFSQEALSNFSSRYRYAPFPPDYEIISQMIHQSYHLIAPTFDDETIIRYLQEIDSHKRIDHSNNVIGYVNDIFILCRDYYGKRPELLKLVPHDWCYCDPPKRDAPEAREFGDDLLGRIGAVRARICWN
jgi:hypothetical protein